MTVVVDAAVTVVLRLRLRLLLAVVKVVMVVVFLDSAIVVLVEGTRRRCSARFDRLMYVDCLCGPVLLWRLFPRPVSNYMRPI